MPDLRIQVAEDATGAIAYAVPCPPNALPPVPPAALLAAWEAARSGARAGTWGPPRSLIFRGAKGDALRLDIADRDARAWAEAVDRGAADLGTLPGLSLCLRLLALVDGMARFGFLAGMFDVTAEGIDLHPALLRAAASMPLDHGARFDAEALRRLLSRGLPARASA
jgi:hypothetical protein